jgi:hypothetical protein
MNDVEDFSLLSDEERAGLERARRLIADEEWKAAYRKGWRERNQLWTKPPPASPPPSLGPCLVRPGQGGGAAAPQAAPLRRRAVLRRPMARAGATVSAIPTLSAVPSLSPLSALSALPRLRTPALPAANGEPSVALPVSSSSSSSSLQGSSSSSSPHFPALKRR